jgi:hypothetical protein
MASSNTQHIGTHLQAEVDLDLLVVVAGVGADPGARMQTDDLPRQATYVTVLG